MDKLKSFYVSLRKQHFFTFKVKISKLSYKACVSLGYIYISKYGWKIIDEYHYNGHCFCIFNHILYYSYRAQKKVVLFCFSEESVHSSVSSNVNLIEEEGSLFCSTDNFMTCRAGIFLSKVVCCLTGERKKKFKWCYYAISSILLHCYSQPERKCITLDIS